MLSFGFRRCILSISFPLSFLISLWCRKHTSIWSIYKKHFLPISRAEKLDLEAKNDDYEGEKEEICKRFCEFHRTRQKFYLIKVEWLAITHSWKGGTLKLSGSLTSRNPFNIMFITNDWSFIRFPFFPSILFLFSNNNQSTLHIILPGIRTNKPIN